MPRPSQNILYSIVNAIALEQVVVHCQVTARDGEWHPTHGSSIFGGMFHGKGEVIPGWTRGRLGGVSEVVSEVGWVYPNASAMCQDPIPSRAPQHGHFIP